MSAYRAYQATGQRRFELVERELVDPRPGHVRFRVHSCGVCHSDALAVEGLRPDPGQPVVPGHEIVGVIDAVGDGVSRWAVGDRVGVGFLGGPCGVCARCRRGDFVNCDDQPRPGTTTDADTPRWGMPAPAGWCAFPMPWHPHRHGHRKRRQPAIQRHPRGHPLTEVLPFEDAPAAYERMMSGQARLMKL
jgi:hypothetical protein